LYEELVKVPLIIKSPVLPSGRRTNYKSMVDISPFILDSLGIPAPPDFRGRSVYGSEERPVYLELSDSNEEGRVGNLEGPKSLNALYPTSERKNTAKQKSQAAILNGWKMIKFSNPEKYSVYDLKNDPKEVNDLYNDSLEINEDLKGILRKFDVDSNSTDTNDSADKIKESGWEIEEDMKTLGY
jgi:arylsulfatase A-like enzyme